MQAVGRFLGSRWLSSEQGNAIIRKLRSRNLIADMTPYIVSRVYFLIRVSGEFPPPGSAFYIGFDPTACSLHLGNLLGLIVATHLRLEGYQPIFLVSPASKWSLRVIRSCRWGVGLLEWEILRFVLLPSNG